MLLNRVSGRKKAGIANTVTYTSGPFDDILNGFIEGDTGIDAAEKLSPVAAGHRILTNSIASMPWMIRQKTGDMRSEPDHYLSYTLKIRGNEYMSPYTVKKIILSQAYWYGAGYAWIYRDGKGRVKEIIPLPSAGHTRYVDESTGMVWHSFSVGSDNPNQPKLTRKFSESELLIYYFESYDGMRGRGILDIAKDSIATDGMAQKFGKSFYKNGARLSGIISVPTVIDEDVSTRYKDEFAERYGGADNAFRVAVLDSGVTYTPIGTSQRDSQFIETRTFSVGEISRFTGIPGYMLGTGNQSYNSNEQQQLDFVKNTLTPHIIQFEQEWAYKLFTADELKNGYYLRLNETALLRSDNKARAEYYQMMTQMGVYNPDECRALEDMSPLPNGTGKLYWQSKNYAPIDDLSAFNTNTGGEKK